MPKPIVTLARVTQLLEYNPDTGIFKWIATTSNRIQVGDVAGSPHASGHISIGIDGRLYLAHRLAWLIMTGDWPSKKIDHKNVIPNDNRFDNLRDVTQAHNLQNQKKAHKDCESGLLGAYKAGNSWKLEIYTNGKKLYLGTFPTAELAHEAYVAAKRSLHVTCTI